MHATGTASLVVRFISGRAIPVIQLYALYVLAHGEDGPGGGFQAGVIFAAAFVLGALVWGWEVGRRQMREGVSDVLLPLGALIYAAVGFGSLLLGGAFLEYERYAPEHAHLAHHLGLTAIELGVAITVAGSMVTLFFEMARPQIFAGRAPPPSESPESTETEPQP